MVVTLRNGVQIKQRVTEYEIRSMGSDVISMSWKVEPPKLSDNFIRFLDNSEIVAVHTEYEDSDS